MKKLVFAVAIVATLVVALMSTNSVFAQGPAPATPQTPGSGNSYGRGAIGNGTIGNGGMMGARGMGASASGVAAGDGILHDGMIAVYAEKLGITVEDLNARLTAGETMAQIASSAGLTAEQFTTLMSDARAQAVDQAVKDGTLTQAQADWMGLRGNAMGAGGRGAGRGMRGNTADCLYLPQTTP